MWMVSRGTLFHSLQSPVLMRVVQTIPCPPSEGIQRQGKYSNTSDEVANRECLFLHELNITVITVGFPSLPSGHADLLVQRW